MDLDLADALKRKSKECSKLCMMKWMEIITISESTNRHGVNVN